MKELVDILPQIIIYIALGYSFIQTYKYVRVIKQDDGIEATLTGSLVVGFVLKCVFEIIPSIHNVWLDNIIMILGAIVLGYLTGVIINSKLFGAISRFFKIKQTPNSSIWRDIEDPDKGIIVRLENYETKTVFDGLYVLGEAYKRLPIIQLSGYRKTVDNEIEVDYKDEPQRTIVLDTSKFDEISVFYDTNSPKVKNWNK